MRLLVLLLALAALPAQAQREGVLQIDDELSELLRRQDTAGRLPADAETDMQPVSAYEAARLLDSLATRVGEMSPADRALVRRYRGEDGPATLGAVPTLGLYRDGVSPVRVEGEGYAFELSPLLYVGAGPSATTRTARDTLGGDGFAYQSSRGVRVAGHLGRHLFFESRIEENQRRPALLDYDLDRRTSPRLGNAKLIGGRTVIEGETYDYWRARGMVGYRDRFVEARFGRDRNHWGPGETSLLLSDYATEYDQLQLRAHAGPVRYAAVFARLVTPEGAVGNTIFPSKYAAVHQLGLSLGDFDIELFETVVFADDTTNGNRTGFEVGYLNPLVFFRAVEADQSTADNVMLGTSLAWRPTDGVRAYYQLLLDELRLSRLTDDWWGNKFGVLVGVHLVDIGLPGLDVRAEAARLRPYLYSHRTESTAFVHYSDPLGHPAGGNANDLSLLVRYRPTVKWQGALNLAWTQQGRSTETENFGEDPRDSYETRVSSEGIETLQGVRRTTLLVEARAGYEILPSMMVEGALFGRSTDDALLGRRREATAMLQLRWLMPFRSERF